MTDGLQRLADSFTQQAASTLERTISRRGLLVRMTVVGSALTISPLRYLLRPGSAWAGNSGCTTCTSGICFTSPNSTFCCSINGSNTCPSGTHPCGWWRCCIPTTYCMSGYRYFVDCCNPNCGSPHCENGYCDSRVTCCFPAQWTDNCAEGYGTVECRAVLCVNPSKVYDCYSSPVHTESTCCQGSTASGCPNYPNCCDSCGAC